MAARIGLEGRGLDLGYNARPVVHAADIRLQAGRVAALVGPNGSGKSTLLRGLARLHHLDAGLLRLGDGTDANSLRPKAFAREVTMLAQSRPMPSGLAVHDVVGFGRHPYRARLGGGDPEGTAAVDRALRLTGVADIAERAVDELSGGQLQRVWLACCLAQDTGVLLLDEPTTFLDLRYQVELLDLVRDLADTGDIAVGLVLHDLDHAAAVADELHLIADGRIRACGPPAEVLRAELLTEVYGIPIEVDHDPRTDALHVRPVRRRIPVPGGRT